MCERPKQGAFQRIWWSEVGRVPAERRRRWVLGSASGSGRGRWVKEKRRLKKKINKKGGEEDADTLGSKAQNGHAHAWPLAWDNSVEKASWITWHVTWGHNGDGNSTQRCPRGGRCSGVGISKTKQQGRLASWGSCSQCKHNTLGLNKKCTTTRVDDCLGNTMKTIATHEMKGRPIYYTVRMHCTVIDWWEVDCILSVYATMTRIKP